MTENEIRDRIVAILKSIAPEADLSTLQPGRNLRDQLDIDSMDMLNFVIAIDSELQLAIPESEYSRLTTLDDCVRYVTGRLGSE